MERTPEGLVGDAPEGDSGLAIVPMDTAEAAESQVSPNDLSEREGTPTPSDVPELAFQIFSNVGRAPCEIESSTIATTEIPEEPSESAPAPAPETPVEKTRAVQQLKRVVLRAVPVAAKPAQSAASPATKQLAIAPKPISLIRKITVSNVRPKTNPTTVVAPSGSGQIKFIKATPSSSTATGPVLRLRQAVNLQNAPRLAVVPEPPDGAGNAQKTTPRYISLQQAQQMGLVSGGKINQVLALSPMKQSANPNSSATVRQAVPTTVISPAKILPAPLQVATSSAGKVLLTSISQNYVIKSASKSAQVIKLDGLNSATNTILTPIPSGQKFVRLVSSSITSPSNVQTKIGIPSSPIRIAPVPASSTRLLQINAKLVPSKSPQSVPKTIVIDSQGIANNILQVVTSNSQNSATTTTTTTATIMTTTSVVANASVVSSATVNSTTIASTSSNTAPVVAAGSMVFKKAISKPMQKLVPINISSVQKAVQNSSTPSFTITALPVVQKSPLKEEKMDSRMSDMEVDKSDYLLDEEMEKSFISYMSPNVDNKPQHDILKSVDCSMDFGMRPRKPCNCTKSQCLKLYCDCFANGEFCNNCNCNNCYNNLENEEYRQKAIRTCLERNPNAFRPKIGRAKNYGLEMIRRHNKGCNCKRSGCLKNYCECYEGKIACSANCKCIGCRNVEDNFDRRSLRRAKADIVMKRLGVTCEDMDELRDLISDDKNLPTSGPSLNSHIKRPTTYMTNDLIEAICQCLIAQAADTETLESTDSSRATRHVLEEFSRCLQDFIKTTQNSTGSSIQNNTRGSP